MKGKRIKRNAAFNKASKKITSLVNECKVNFRVAHDDSRQWQDYLEYVDEIVITGLLKVVACSLGYFLDETDPTLTHGILFEVIFLGILGFCLRAQSFTYLMADLCQDINRVSSFSRCLNRTFP